MRFGGHQTFYVREGWLAKGLALLLEDPSEFDDPFVADQLGVGRNMAKSIEHWLLATGLATKSERRRRPEKPRLQATELSRIIGKHDPWFLDPGTWWFLHINLVRNPAHAATWHWFFNHYASSRFDRPTVVAQLEQHERLRAQRVPSPKTLARDVSCFLGSYAVEVPYRRKDPEEEIELPLSGAAHHSPLSRIRLLRAESPAQVDISSGVAVRVEGAGADARCAFRDGRHYAP